MAREAFLCSAIRTPFGRHGGILSGIRPDDLIVLSGDHLIQSCKALRSDLEYIDFEDEVKLTVLRGQELLQFTLRPARDVNPPKKGQP